MKEKTISKMRSSEFLVIGSGIAGLTFALKTARRFPHAKVTIITKGDAWETNTKYAQGGIAVALDENFDSYKKHVEDTLRAGDGLCNRKIVELVVRKGPELLNEMIQWGARFDRVSKNQFHLGREGGHSVNRIIHHKDTTGLEMERTLLMQIRRQKNIELLTHRVAVDLVLSKKPKLKLCCGAVLFDVRKNNMEVYFSKFTLLATGGAGQVYRFTTNPVIATGDGIAMAYRAGAVVKNMEFVQFHPTALYHPSDNPLFLISEAVRGFGALLKNAKGEGFMTKYDARGELASRDIVARAIETEMKKSKEKFVYLDCRHLDAHLFKKHFPTIFKKCSSLGIDIRTDMIPVTPVAHYICGGIVTDSYGRTTIPALYACGECACTGLHGANRLASNSLLEALVFAGRCYKDIEKKYLKKSKKFKKDFFPEKVIPALPAAPEKPNPLTSYVNFESMKMKLQMVMSESAGIVRKNNKLRKAKKEIENIARKCSESFTSSLNVSAASGRNISLQLVELRNLIDVAYLIVKQSVARKNNRGVFYKQ